MTSRGELKLTEESIRGMISSTSRNLGRQIFEAPIEIQASDSYGENNHRTWLFVLDDGLAIGTLERYWTGLKMISSVLKGQPRTYFFTEKGERCNSKDLKLNGQQ